MPELDPAGLEAAAKAMWGGDDWEQAGRCYAWNPEMPDCAEALKQLSTGFAAYLSVQEQPDDLTAADLNLLGETARLRGWIEGWQCARLKSDGSLPPAGEVREALMLAGFSDELIAVAVQAALQPEMPRRRRQATASGDVECQRLGNPCR